MKHAPGFLAIVNDAKSRVKELNFREVKAQLDAGAKFTLVDVRESVMNGPAATCREPSTWAKASSSVTSKQPLR